MDVEIYKMTYKKRKNELVILGEEFVINNKNKGFLIINNKKNKLNSKLAISINNFTQEKIKMILNKNIFNKSYMFKNCESLEYFIPLSIDYERNSNIPEIDVLGDNEELNRRDEIRLNSSIDSDIDVHPLYNNVKNEFDNSSIISQENEDYYLNNSNSTILYFENVLKLTKNNFSIFKEMF